MKIGRSYKQAFTLIELLVVIAIVAMVAAILFPVFAKAKEAAKQSQDLSNLRQLGFATLIYAHDYDDRSLVAGRDEGGEWFNILYPYVSNREIFFTPAYVREPEAPETDYLLNGVLAHGTSLSQISSTVEQIAFATRDQGIYAIDYAPWPYDGINWDNLEAYRAKIESKDEGEDDDAWAKAVGPNWFTDRIEKLAWREQGGNFGFVDGHAKFHVWEQTLQESLPGMHNVDRLWFPDEAATIGDDLPPPPL